MRANTIRVAESEIVTLTLSGGGVTSFTNDSGTGTRVSGLGSSVLLANPTTQLVVNIADGESYDLSFASLASGFNPTNGIRIVGNKGTNTVTITDLGDTFGHSATGNLDIRFGTGDTVTLSTPQSYNAIEIDASTTNVNANQTTASTQTYRGPVSFGDGVELTALDIEFRSTVRVDGRTASLQGAVNFSRGANLKIDIDGAAPGEFGMLNVVGTVKIGGRNFFDFSGGSFRPRTGDSFVLLSNDGDDPITLAADAVPEGSIVGRLNGVNLYISYFGGDGNDLMVLTQATSEFFDFGDAPTTAQSGFASSYPTSLSDSGAKHAISGLFLGQLVDAEPDGRPDAKAGGTQMGGDDNAGTADEDGVFVSATVVAASATSITSSFAITASGVGKLDAWIDFNRDGDWNDAGEQIFTSRDVAAGLNILSFTVPAGATPGETGARFRISSAGGLAPTGAADDGEVEDYIVTILDGDAGGGADVEIDSPAPGMLDVVADGNDVVIRSGAVELLRVPGAKLKSLKITDTDGDDTLNLANLDAIFAGLVTGDAGAGNDTLRLTGSGQELDLTQIDDAAIQGMETIDITGSGDNSLKLDVDEVVNLSSTTDTLRVVHDAGDTVNYGSGWTVKIPQIVDGQFVHVLEQSNAKIEVANTLAFRNPLRSLDTNHDGTVAPLDALIIINRLNESSPGSLSTPLSVAGLIEYFYIDTNGDGSVSPIDVLQVINFLNDPTGNPEGEAPIETAILTFAVRPPEFRPARVGELRSRQDDTNPLRRSEQLIVSTMYHSPQRLDSQVMDRDHRLRPRRADWETAFGQVLKDGVLADLGTNFD